MEFSEEWKSLWPISSVFSPPLLLSSKPLLGPLFFNPSPKTLTPLFSSSSLSPHLPPPYPHLSLSRFLQTSSSFSIPPSVSSSIATRFGPQHPYTTAASSPLTDNRLQLLRCPNNAVLAFFPTGENSDRVGFVALSVKDSNLSVGVNEDDGEIFTAKNKFSHRIIQLSVNPIADSGFGFSSSVGNDCVSVGFLLARTMYSVHWFSVRVIEVGLSFEKPVLVYLGSKLFKSCSVVHACWSPQLAEESVVLLESGELFLFDLDSCSKNGKFKGKRLRVSWDDSGCSGNGQWLSCEFSWHPRILIVARSNAVFLVDLRFDGCNVSCLLKINMIGTKDLVEKDRFIAFSKAGSDGYFFTMATERLLLLCDVRKPLMPVLQWSHGLDNPCYINVFRLSELRWHSRDDKYKWASESGFGIVMGSFWNCEFGLFCYGPSLPAPSGSVASKISRFCNSLYAWELPSELSVSGRECCSGSCLVREEFSKDALPEWIDWRQKKEIVLGFCILDKNLSALLSEPDSFGGFTLIRLMSSGKLEAQRFCASWDFVKILEEARKESSLRFKDSLLYSMGDEEYKFPKRYKYLKLDYLYANLNSSLAKVLVSKMNKPCRGPQEKESFNATFHEVICEKLKAYGLSGLTLSPAVSNVFKDISLPTSIYEVALRRMWSGLPMEHLQLAFSSYSEFLEVLVDQKKVSLEFLVIPDQPQLPPFILRNPSCRSNKWSHKVPRGNVLVGPVLPLPILHTLREVHKNGCSDLEAGGISSQTELTLHCNEVMQVASELAVSDSGSELHNDHVVSLAEDREETCFDSQKPKPFFLYKPVAFSDKCSTIDATLDDSVCTDEKFTTLISKISEKGLLHDGSTEVAGPELSDDLCPVELRFDAAHAMNFGPNELKVCKLLKRQYSKWQEGFDTYQEFCTRSKI